MMQLSDLLGEWQLVSWTHKRANETPLYFPFGKHPKGQLTFKDNQFYSQTTRDLSTVTLAAESDPLKKADETLTLSGTFLLNDNQLQFDYQQASIAELVNQSRETAVYYDNHQTLIISRTKQINGQSIEVKGTFIRQGQNA